MGGLTARVGELEQKLARRGAPAGARNTGRSAGSSRERGGQGGRPARRQLEGLARRRGEGDHVGERHRHLGHHRPGPGRPRRRHQPAAPADDDPRPAAAGPDQFEHHRVCPPDGAHAERPDGGGESLGGQAAIDIQWDITNTKVATIAHWIRPRSRSWRTRRSCRARSTASCATGWNSPRSSSSCSATAPAPTCSACCRRRPPTRRRRALPAGETRIDRLRLACCRRRWRSTRPPATC